MNVTIKEFIQKEIQKGLKQCDNGQRQSFVLIFMSSKMGILPRKVADVISDDLIEGISLSVDDADLSRALTMVENTVKSNKEVV